ncbi:MAG: type II toxin-antitoxin system VapC family toxin [Flavobacteriales bacterium]|nr:type II toxin-antitoxin system VapC family toxin [Flavobacteriales bacterium]
MKALDTNILVRFLTNDDEKQAKKVYALFKQAEQSKETLFVPQLVVLELIWVLESAYQVSRKHIIDVIGGLLLMSILQFENQHAIQQWCQAAQKNKADLSDLLIAYTAKANQCSTVLTFDKKAANVDVFELVK